MRSSPARPLARRGACALRSVRLASLHAALPALRARTPRDSANPARATIRRTAGPRVESASVMSTDRFACLGSALEFDVRRAAEMVIAAVVGAHQPAGGAGPDRRRVLPRPKSEQRLHRSPRARSASTCCTSRGATTAAGRRRSSSACTAVRCGQPRRRKSVSGTRSPTSTGSLWSTRPVSAGTGPGPGRAGGGPGLMQGCQVHRGADRHTEGDLQHRLDADLRERAFQRRRNGVRTLLHAVRSDRRGRAGGAGAASCRGAGVLTSERCR